MSSNSSTAGRTYNLRQRKKLVGQDAQKSKNSSKIPVPKKTGLVTKTESANAKPKQRKARAVPDFKKLHQNWDDKFNKGKAVNKRTCTQIQAFDLTRPVTRSQKKSSKEDSGSDEQQEYLDDDALQSILDVAGIDDKCETPSESVTKTTSSISPSNPRSQHHTQETSELNGTKGIKSKQAPKEDKQIMCTRDMKKGFDKIPECISPRNNVLRPRQQRVQEVKTNVLKDDKLNVIRATKIGKENKHESRTGNQKLSMKDMQKEFDIQFETDVSALNSILNNTGVGHARHNAIGRQTIAGIASSKYSVLKENKVHLRTSIYDQPIRMSIFDRRWTKANFRNQLPTSKPVNKTPSPAKPVLATPARVLLQRNQNQITPKIPGTASRVINPKFSAVTVVNSCNSPAIRKTVDRPTPQRVPKQCSTKKVRWAEVLKSPDNEHSVTEENGVDNVVTTLKFTDDDEMKTDVKPNQDTMTETYLQKVIELEEQLLQEIQKLQEDKKPIQNNFFDSSTQPTDQQTMTMPVASCALDLTNQRKDITDTLRDSVNDDFPVDLTVKTPSRLWNHSQPPKVFKSPFPMDGPVIPLDSLKSARTVPDRNDTPVGSVASRLRSAYPGSVVQTSPAVSTNPLKLTSCLSSTPGSIRRPMNCEVTTARTCLPNPLTSVLHGGTVGQHERDKIRDFMTVEKRTPCQNTIEWRTSCQKILEGRTQDQMQPFQAHLNTLGSHRNIPASTCQHQGFRKPSITEHGLHSTVQYASPHTLSNHHHETSELQEQPEDLTCGGKETVQYHQTLRSTSVTDGRVDALRPASRDWHDVTLSAQSIRGSSHIVSSTPQVADKLSRTHHLSAWGSFTPHVTDQSSLTQPLSACGTHGSFTPHVADQSSMAQPLSACGTHGSFTPHVADQSSMAQPLSACGTHGSFTPHVADQSSMAQPLSACGTRGSFTPHVADQSSMAQPLSACGTRGSFTQQIADQSSMAQPLSAYGSFTPHVADQSSLTRPLSACGEPGQIRPDDQYYKKNYIHPSETLLNVITPVVRPHGRLLGQSSVVVSPVPRYVHRPGFVRANHGVSGLSDGASQSALGSVKDVNEVCKASSPSSKAGVSLTHAQKLDHVMKMALDTGGKYHEVILNEEVALFACRLTSKFSPKPKFPHDFTNPVGSFLLHGDERHFIAINEATGLKASPVPGSAFMALKH